MAQSHTNIKYVRKLPDFSINYQKFYKCELRDYKEVIEGELESAKNNLRRQIETHQIWAVKLNKINEAIEARAVQQGKLRRHTI